MKKRILVGTIAFSDPIRGEKDGPMLHIVRHYQPEKVYLICTKEMFEKETTWHMNEQAIQMLQSDCKVEIIATKIEDPHSFDTTSKPILKICEQIKEQNPHRQILLNISSGTQQMNTVFGFLAMADPDTYLPIQVISRKNQNTATFNPEKDDLEEWFETNIDNEPGMENRCIEPKFLNFRKPVTQFQIESLIENYDYSAAYMLYKMNQRLFVEEVGTMLMHAKKRLNLEYKEADKLARQLRIKEELYPVKRMDISELIEFYLSMNIKQKRGELSDMTLRLEIMTEYIAKYIMENIMKIKLQEITTQNKKQNSKIYYTSKQKAEKKMEGITQYLNDKFKSEFVWGKPISSRILVYILEYLVKRDEFKRYRNCVQELGKFLDVVEQVRNPAAHTIMAVIEDAIRNAYGKDSAVLMKKMKDILQFIFGNQVPEWGYAIYDNCINSKVKQLLQQEV